MKHRMFVDVIQRVKNSGMNYDKGHDLHGENDPGKIANWLLQNKHMENARITSIIEFGRCVHAEMAAIMDAARRGHSTPQLFLATSVLGISSRRESDACIT